MSAAINSANDRLLSRRTQHLGLWEESHAPPDREPPEKEITFDPAYSQVI
jgi:hypothetical protein